MTPPDPTGDTARRPTTERPAPERDLVVLFAKSLRLLGQCGRSSAANRLAAQAWWALKDDDPAGAQRINGVMHYLAKLPDEPTAAARSHTHIPATTTTGVT